MGRLRRVRDEDLYEPVEEAEPVGELYEEAEERFEPASDPYEPVGGPLIDDPRALYSRMSRSELLAEIARLANLVVEAKARAKALERLCLESPGWAKPALWERIDEAERLAEHYRRLLRYALMNYAALCDRQCEGCRVRDLCEGVVWAPPRRRST